MQCQTCGFQNAATARQCAQCGMVITPRSQMGSIWSWFFFGTTLVLAMTLFGIIWTIMATGLYSELIVRLRDRIPASVVAQVPAITLASPSQKSSTLIPELSSSPTGVAAMTPTISSGTPTLGTPAAAPAIVSTPASIPTAVPASPTMIIPRSSITPSLGSGSVTMVSLGAVIESGVWRLLARDARTETGPDGLSRMIVDLTIKNDSARTALIVLPSTSIGPARTRLVEMPVQLSDPPHVQLRLSNSSAQFIGGSFLGADGNVSGGFNFYAAPGDAIRLTYAFPLPAGSAGPYRLDVSFGVDAGGTRASVALDRAAPTMANLDSNELTKAVGKEERITLPGLWAFTVASIEVAAPLQNGERTVSAKLIAENLSDRSLVIGATREDPTGAERDFYVTDREGNLAYSSSNSMPSSTIPAKATRTVTIQLKASREFSTTGPHRFSIVVDAKRDRSAVFVIK